ncbi:type II secretion system GspH family protein [Enterobacter chuandaensis]|uniref:type II secretion system protein n=1 Tax=Enterobacter chuandaensis TaxID=2497875 RepID=UPI00207562BD|nr:type II secretion system protein [Enterobacter chuandaensis]MCM7589150.1 type II secretion system GspH family protein [Enterobacter chuandaensis]
MRIRKDSGFSLLEIIIVLAIAGGVMVMYTHYARKKAENIAQQNVADALAEEMKGVLEFIDDDTIALVGKKNETDSPLYSDENSEYDDYHTRLTNEIDTTDTGSKDNYYLWGDDNNKTKQQRYLFLSSNCKSSLKSDFAFEKEYLPCFMRNVATNSTAVIDRVGFAGGDKDSDRKYDINRIDTIVRFEKEEANSDYHFADFAPHFTEAFSKAGFTVSHAMVVHRTNSSSNWQLVLNKKDKKTPIELSSMASNLDALDQYKNDEFGVRFTIDTNDNSGNSSNAGSKVCWSRGDSGVKLCYDDNAGMGAHGEDTVLDLTMTDPDNTRNNDMAGTLKANLVMENTSTKVAIFQRAGTGWLVFDENNNPVPLTVNEMYGGKHIAEIALDDQKVDTYNPYVDSERPLSSRTYLSERYDAYELVTPPSVDYAGPNRYGENLDHTYDGEELPDSEKQPSYLEYSDFAHSDPVATNEGGFRYAVQTCPKVEQQLTLIDGDGQPVLDDEGKIRKFKYTRQLYPRLAASISSIAAQPQPDSGHPSGPWGFSVQDQNRAMLKDEYPVGMFGGIAVQVEFAEQDTTVNGPQGFPAKNAGGHYIYHNTKYVWIVSATMGMYHATTGEGMNILNPNTVSYTITKWCSTIPQSGTPEDLIDTQQYE